MAGNRTAASRSHANPEAHRDQLVVLGSLVALAIAVVIVLVGLYVAVYRPPRAHVLTVGSQQWDASAIQRRALYMLLYQQSIAPKSQTEIVSKTLETVEREEALRSKAKEIVPEVTNDDVTKELQQLLAPIPQTPPAPSISGPSGATVTIGTATPEASTSPTATPTVDQAAYTKALQERLSKSKLTKAELDGLIAAGLYEDRLHEKFMKELPKTSPQVNLVIARLADEATAKQVRSIGLRPNVDFGQVASQNSVSDAKGARAGVPQWVIVDQLDAVTRDVVKQLGAGDISPVVRNGVYYEVYKVVEVSADREFSDDLKDQMANNKVLDWLNTTVVALKPERDLTPEKETWITDHVIKDYTKASATPRAQ